MSKPEYAKFHSLLVNSNEKIQKILGNGIAENFIATGTLGNGFSILTDERVYFKGKCLVRSGKSFYRKLEERVVDLNDITGTGFVHNRNMVVHILKYLLIIPATISMLTGTPALSFIFWFLFAFFVFLDKKFTYSVFEISFAGGGIGFDLSWISHADAESFQKILRQAKDNKKKQQEKSLENILSAQHTPSVNLNNNIDDLLKLKELLDKGVITQDEFAAKKKQVLGI